MKLFAVVTALTLAPIAVTDPAGAGITYAIILWIGTCLPQRPSRRVHRQAKSDVEVRTHSPARPSQRASDSDRPGRDGRQNLGAAL